MKINLTLNIDLEINRPNLKEIIEAFKRCIFNCFQEVVVKVLTHFAREYMKDGTIAKLLGCSKVTWKTSTGAKTTDIFTIFGKIKLPQLQVKTEDGKRKYITRILLGIKPRVRIPEITIKMIGLMGSLTSYRVVRKIASMFTDVKFSLMNILRCVRKTGKELNFEIDNNQTNEFEADATGIPIKQSGKRGEELKILAQRTKDGRIRIAGMEIDQYKKGWERLFEPLKEALKRFPYIFLVTDGDTSPLDGLRGIKVILQRCLFHIPHEIKYKLWEDKVKRKGEIWRYVLAKILEITNVKRIFEEPGVLKNITKWKKNLLTRLTNYCRKREMKSTVTFLENAYGDIFRGIERKISGGTISLIERVIRTINQRINIAQWSSESALAVAKIRGAYYYNNFDA